jgi:hypothetical protein
MASALCNHASAVRWCRVIGLPQSRARYLLAHIKQIEELPNRQLAAWRAKQATHIATHSVWALTDDQKAKVEHRMLKAGNLPFGQALARSEARYSAYLWYLVAKDVRRTTDR